MGSVIRPQVDSSRHTSTGHGKIVLLKPGTLTVGGQSYPEEVTSRWERTGERPIPHGSKGFHFSNSFLVQINNTEDELIRNPP